MKILVVGSRGMLGQEVLARLHDAGFIAIGTGRPEVDITQRTSIQQALACARPDVLINAAAYTTVDKAEAEPAIALAVNRDGAAYLAQACQQAGIPLIHISTDYVFDGSTTRPYHEETPAAPLGSYGCSKWEGEEAIRSCHQAHLIVRTSWLYGQHGTNFVKTMLHLARKRDELRIVDDQHGCPTWARELANALVMMCQRIRQDRGTTPWGTYHFCGAGQTTWYAFAQAIFEEAKAFETLAVRHVHPIPTAAYPTPARRPAYSVLDCAKIQVAFSITPRLWRASLRECIKELYACTPLSPVPS